MGADPGEHLQLIIIYKCGTLITSVVGGFEFAGHHPTSTIGSLGYRAAEGIEKYLKNGGQLV